MGTDIMWEHRVVRTVRGSANASAEETARSVDKWVAGLSDEDINIIGRRVWQNECLCKEEYLTHWNKNEEFPSLGIGHFIWYPAGRTGPFKETFPDLLAYMASRGVALPDWLQPAATGTEGELQPPRCPWATRDEFYSDISSERMRELRSLMLSTMGLQARFMIARLTKAVPLLVAHSPPEERRALLQRFHQLSLEPGGMFALLDYVHFKGEGVQPSERYAGQGWGLLQVLTAMGQWQTVGQLPEVDPKDAFVKAAMVVLSRRVSLAAKERREDRWLQGWLRRVDAYAYLH
eukprot:jgi/Mesvir1/866/Mv17437-RA.1